MQFGIIAILRSDDTDIITIGIFRSTAVNLDILVQFHRCIAGIAAVLHAIVHSSDFMRCTIVVFIDNAVHSVLATITICAIDTVLAILDMDISRRIFAIGPFGSRQANMTFRAIFTNDTFNGYAIFAISAFDRNAILAVDTDTRYTVFTVNTDMAINTIFAVFTLTADIDGIT